MKKISLSLTPKHLEQFFALLVFFVFIFGYVMQSVQWFKAVPGDLGDPRFNNYFLEHAWLWASGAKVDLWSPDFFYPFKNISGFSDNHFGSAVFYVIFRYIGFSREYAFDAWFVIGALLNFFASFWVLRNFQFGPFASAIGAFIFSGSLPVLMVDNAAQLNYRFMIPLAWLLLFRFLTQKRLIYLGALSLCVTEQFLCSIYLGVLLGYSLIALILVWILLHLRNGFWESGAVLELKNYISVKKNKEDFFGVFLVLISVVTTFVLLFKYHVIASEYKLSRDSSEIIGMLPQIGSYFLSERSFISGLWSKNLGWFAQRQENQLFIGIGTMIFMLFGAYASFNKTLSETYRLTGRIALFSLVVLMVLTLQIHGYSIYALLLKIPGIKAIRSVGRVILVLLFPIAILAAVAVKKFQDWAYTKQKEFQFFSANFIVYLLIVVIVLPESVLARHDVSLINQWQERLKKVRELVPPQIPSDAILFLPRAGWEPAWAGEIDAMFLAQELRLSTLNGYSGSLPPGYTDLGMSAEKRLLASAKWLSRSEEWVQTELRRVVKIKSDSRWVLNNSPEVELGLPMLINSHMPLNQVFLIEGWALPEPWGTWTLGENAQLLIPIPKKGQINNLLLKVRPYINSFHPDLSIVYSVNKENAISLKWSLVNPPNEIVVSITDADRKLGFLDIRFKIQNPVSPKDLGQGNDNRDLGFGLESFLFR